MKIKIISIIFLMTATGCQCLKCDPELKNDGLRLEPSEGKFFDLLHIGNNFAYKSTTEEDYTIEENCG